MASPGVYYYFHDEHPPIGPSYSLIDRNSTTANLKSTAFLIPSAAPVIEPDTGPTTYTMRPQPAPADGSSAFVAPFQSVVSAVQSAVSTPAPASIISLPSVQTQPAFTPVTRPQRTEQPSYPSPSSSFDFGSLFSSIAKGFTSTAPTIAPMVRQAPYFPIKQQPRKPNQTVRYVAVAVGVVAVAGLAIYLVKRKK